MNNIEIYQSIKNNVQQLHDKEDGIKREIKDFLKEQLIGTEPDNPRNVNLKIETYGGIDGSMLLGEMNITSMFYDEQDDSVGFFEEDDDIPHELDYLNIDEQLEVVKSFCN